MTAAYWRMFNGAKLAKPGVVKRFRETHHMMARCFATGMRPGEVAREMGMSNSRVSVFASDPAFQELVAIYREDVNRSWHEANTLYLEDQNFVRKSTMRMQREICEEAEETGERPPLRMILAMHDSAADRTGFAKRTVAINVNIDAASSIDRARKRAAPVMKVVQQAPEALPAPAFKRRV